MPIYSPMGAVDNTTCSRLDGYARTGKDGQFDYSRRPLIVEPQLGCSWGQPKPAPSVTGLDIISNNS